MRRVSRDVSRELPRLTVEGAGRDRGLACARAHGDAIVSLAEAHRERLATRPGGERRHLAGFFADTDIRDVAQRLLPDLAAEVDAMAAGAGVDRDLLWALNLADEEWWYSEERYGEFDASVGCSAAAVVTPDECIVGQNMDLPGYFDGAQLLLSVPTGDEYATIVTAAGMVALCGAHTAGLGLCCNQLVQLPRSPRGLPVAFVVREALAVGTFDGGAGALRSLPHASGQNYLLAGVGAAANFECSARGVTVSDGWRLAHTNHPIAAEERAPRDQVGRAGAARELDSRARLHFLEHNLDAIGSIEACAAALSDRKVPLSKGPATDADETATFASFVASFNTAGDFELQVSCGPPHRSGWTAVQAPA
jgi:hypothetical protein